MSNQLTTTTASGMEVAIRRPARSGPGVFARVLLRDKVTLIALFYLVLVILAVVFANFVAPHDPYEQSLRGRLRPPMTAAATPGAFPHVLGTDALGRDQLSRLIHGGRISLTVGFASVIVSGLVGTVLGLLAGYYRGWVDDLVMRIVDVQMGFPTLLVALLVLYALGPSFLNVILVLAITRWMVYARVTRGLMLGLQERPFVEAARTIGCNDRRIIFRHMLPNLLSPVLVLATVEFALMILIEASLDFLGMGIQQPESSWGLMLALGREYIARAWWLVTFPGLAILLTTLSLNLLATWLRAVTDPVQRWRWLNPNKAGRAS